jgi:hypothetical protein
MVEFGRGADPLQRGGAVPTDDPAGSDVVGLRRVCALCLADGVPPRSLVVAGVVGTLLNLINQGDALLAGAALDWTKIALTYVVPYCVATYGAVSYRMRVERLAAR